MGRPKSAYAAQAVSSDYVGTKDAAAILGVSISSVQKLVERGKLEAWRTEGGHRRVSMESLKALAHDFAPAAAASAAAPANGKRLQRAIRILVVEDNPVMSKVLGKHLERFGDALEVAFSNDAAEALLKITEDKPDLVITDLAMQPFDGFHLIRVLRSSAKYQDIIVIALTGLSEEEIQKKGGLGDNTTVYRKPLPYERLSGFLDAMAQMRGISLGAVRK